MVIHSAVTDDNLSAVLCKLSTFQFSGLLRHMY